MSLVPTFPGKCLKEVVGGCIPHNVSDCFGAALDYSATSLDFVSDANTIEKAKEKLLLWSGLKSVPKCWEFIQPLLCAVYLPKCENGTVYRPDRTLCEGMKSPCKIVEIEHGWPDFMLCDNDDVYADECPNAIKNTFNKSECEKPLMATSNSRSWYEDVEGCGLQCMNPLFNQQEHDDMHVFIAVWASITAICTLFAMLSFFIDWKNSSKYPARIIFYINLCFFLCTFGWLAQFFQGSRDEIICRRDGTVRLGEPVGHDESPSCVIIFVFVYFFVMAGVAWFVVLSYSWKVMFQALGKSQDPLKDKTLHFHLFSWSVAFVLLIASLAVSQIDGDSMSGICFIGYKNHWYRMAFLLVPIGIMLLIGGFYLCGGLNCLLTLKHGHDGLLSDSAISKITWTMIRIGVFALLAFIFVFVTFASHVYQIVNQPLWDRSFRDYIRCDANITILEKLHADIEDPAATKCHIQHRPNVAVLKLHLFAMFGTGIVMSTWVWTKASFANWRRAWFKLIGRSDNEMKRIRRRSKIIAKAFANRHRLGFGKKRNAGDGSNGNDNEGMDAGELEFSAHTLSHQDPVGMDFDLNSVSQELSSNWMRNVPKMVRRRGAIMPQPVSSCAPTPSPTPLDAQNADIIWSTDKNMTVEIDDGGGSQCQRQTGRSIAIDHWKMTKTKNPPRRLPPVKSRRSTFVPSTPMSADNPTAIKRAANPVEIQKQTQCDMLPGLIGHEEIPGSSCQSPAPYVTNVSPMPFLIGQDDVQYLRTSLQTTSVSTSERTPPPSHPYNLRPSRVYSRPEYSAEMPTRSSRHGAHRAVRHVY